MDTIISEKRVAVISGGAGYLGSAIAKQLAKDGMKIALLYNNSSEEKVQKIVQSLDGIGHKAYKCNLKNKHEVEATIIAIEKEVGQLYACVHTAGVAPKPTRLHLAQNKDIEEEFENNIICSFNFLTSVARFLKEHKQGVLFGITTAGVVTQHNTKSRGLYSVTKFALQGMLVSLKEELTPYGIRVYSVAPGVMEGGMNEATPRAFIDMVRSTSPTKKIINATEVAYTISYLCSEKAVSTTELTFLLAPETESQSRVSNY